MTGIERIIAERKRQIEEEGFTAEHDDRWDKGELAQAAMCYCMEPADFQNILDGSVEPCAPSEWPFHPTWWKPTPNNRIQELKKAGALIAAEIDRLQRLEERQKEIKESGGKA
jgi:hypothetical protein